MLAKCRLDDVGPMSRRVAHRCRPDIETDIGPILKPTSVRHRPDMECLLGCGQFQANYMIKIKSQTSLEN